MMTGQQAEAITSYCARIGAPFVESDWEWTSDLPPGHVTGIVLGHRIVVSDSGMIVRDTTVLRQPA